MGGEVLRQLHGDIPPHLCGAGVFGDPLHQHRPDDGDQALGTAASTMTEGGGQRSFPALRGRRRGLHVLYKRVESHCCKTLEYSQSSVGLRRPCTGRRRCWPKRVHIADVERALQKDAVGQGDADSHEQTAGHSAPVALRRAVLCQPGEAGPQGALCGQAGEAGDEHGHQPQRPSLINPGRSVCSH